MTRKEEIKHLEALKGDTYFAQRFGADIYKMIENVENDFPIETGCAFNAANETAQRETAHLKHVYKDAILSIASMAISKLLAKKDTDAFMAYIRETVGIIEYAKLKSKFGVTLTVMALSSLSSSPNKTNQQPGFVRHGVARSPFTFTLIFLIMKKHLKQFVTRVRKAQDAIYAGKCQTAGAAIELGAKFPRECNRYLSVTVFKSNPKERWGVESDLHFVNDMDDQQKVENILDRISDFLNFKV